MTIKDTIAIVTGASGGIGEATARELAARGAKVVLAARNAEKLAQLENELPGSLAMPTDMTKPADVQRLIEKTVETFGRIDILVNNAGQGLRAPVADIDMDDYRAIMELNVFAVLHAIQEVIPIMRTQGSGYIMNISSMVTNLHIPGLAAYSSTKYALNSLSLTAREELAPDGIVVSIFKPTMTATDFGAHSLGTKYDSHAGVGGMGGDRPEDVAIAIADLIESEEAEARM